MKNQMLSLMMSLLLPGMLWAQQPNVNWAISGGGTGQEYVSEICITTDNNIVAAGNFSGALTINGNTYNSVLGGSDIFLVKYDQNMSIMWSKTIGNACIEKLSGIASDALGNIYLTGSYYSSFSIDNNTVMSNGSKDLFIASLNENGNINWLQSFGGAGSDEGKSVRISADGFLYVAASMDMAEFPVSDQPSTGGSAHIAKFSLSGQLIWSICETGNQQSDIEIEDIAVSETGSVFATGFYIGTISAGDNGIISLQSNNNRLWVGAYTSTGNMIYCYTIGQNPGSVTSGTGIAIDEASHAVISGYSSSPLSLGGNYFNSLDRDVLVMELNGSGIPLWSNVIVANGIQSSNKIALNSNGNLAVTGLFVDDFIMGNMQLINSGNSDAFVLNLESGILTGGTSFGSQGNDNAISVIPSGTDFIVSGNFSGGTTASMNAGGTSLQSTGDDDFFITSLTPGMTSGISDDNGDNKMEILTPFPNPASSMVHFAGAFESGSISVNIYSVNGQLTKSIIAVPSFNSGISVDISDLRAGVYNASIIDNNKTFFSKLVVE